MNDWNTAMTRKDGPFSEITILSIRFFKQTLLQNLVIVRTSYFLKVKATKMQLS